MCTWCAQCTFHFLLLPFVVVTIAAQVHTHSPHESMKQRMRDQTTPELTSSHNNMYNLVTSNLKKNNTSVCEVFERAPAHLGPFCRSDQDAGERTVRGRG